MTTYTNHANGEVTEEFVNAPCSLCGKPRRQCRADLKDPFVKVEEDSK